MSERFSFGRAVYEGTINGPDWPVVDDNGVEITPGDQDFGGVELGRGVRTSESGSHIGYVTDYQHPADTALDEQAENVAYTIAQIMAWKRQNRQR